MKVDITSPKSIYLDLINPQKNNPTGDAGDSNFADFFSDALNQVNSKQIEADDAIKGFTLGEIDDIHQVMATVEEAKLSMQLMVQFRNKAIEAYQEISRMQI